MEQLDLTTPIVVAARTSYTIHVLTLDWANQVIRVVLVGSDGADVVAEYKEAQAVAIMTTLNTANLSVKSLYRRVLEKLVADGKLPAGTVSGTAQ